MPTSSTALTSDDPPGDPGRPSRGSDYAALAKIIKTTGLLQRRPGYYAIRFAIVFGLFVGGWAAFALIGDSWWQLLVAAAMGLVFTQVAFLSHDVGHRQVFRSKRADEAVGMVVGNLGLGMSFGWWMGKHTRHHANPNHTDHDPDIQMGPAIAWTDDQAEARQSVIGRALAKWQAWLFFPMLTLEGLNLRYSSFKAISEPSVKRKRLEALLLSLHVIGYLSALFLVLSPGKALLFLAVHQAVFGVYMGCSFAPNHKGMPIITEKIDYLRKQVLTSRNVRGNVIVDYALGGLNYQIEHHLFPSMPMPNLRKAQPLVRNYCARIGVSYEEAGIFRSYREIIASLHSAGAGLRRPALQKS